MNPLTFNEFHKTGYAHWLQLANTELNGGLAELPAWLIGSQTVIPNYSTENQHNNQKFFEIQRVQKNYPGWDSLQYASAKSPETLDSIFYKMSQKEIDGVIISLTDTETNSAKLEYLTRKCKEVSHKIYFEIPSPDTELLQNLKGCCSGGIAFDPVVEWMKSGIHFERWTDNIAAQDWHSEFHPLLVNAYAFHQAGASQVDELAFGLATFVHYLDVLTDSGKSLAEATSMIHFSVSAGTAYLSETAKIRALRFLAHKIVDSYKDDKITYSPCIHGTTSEFLSKPADFENNLIRATIGAMAAITGGCDALIIKTSANVSSSTHFTKVSNHLSLLLAHESRLNEVADPFAGSFLMEQMTLNLIEAAWEQFLHIEDTGGIIAYFQSGDLIAAINKSYTCQIQSLMDGQVMVGLNKFVSDDFTTNPEWIKEPLNPNLLPIRNLALGFYGYNKA